MRAPKIQPVSNIPLHIPKKNVLDNGAELYELRLGNQDILKIEWIFNAGRWFETKPLASRVTAQLLKCGINSMNADKFADFFDFYGAKLKISDDFDNVSIKLYCLTKHLEKLMPVVTEMMLHPLFDNREIEQFCSRNKQMLKLELQKNDVIAYRTFTEKIFGEKHPYGYNSTAKMYDEISRVDLIEHHKRCYTANFCKVIISGKTNDSIIRLLKKHTLKIPESNYFLSIKPENEQIEMPVATRIPASKFSEQASLRVGCKLFNKSHEDYAAFYFANTLLGGYFGARLMQNLREDKGYTYSVYSSVETLKNDGYFYIFTDVNNELKDAALNEIYQELERLQNEFVDKKELEMVRNYSLGMLLNSVDGVFNVSSVIKEVIEDELDFDFFESFVQKTKTITADEVQQIARKYFKKDNLWEVVVG